MWFSVVGGGTLSILLSAQCREGILSHREGPTVGCQLGSHHFYCGSGNHIPDIAPAGQLPCAHDVPHLQVLPTTCKAPAQPRSSGCLYLGLCKVNK